MKWTFEQLAPWNVTEWECSAQRFDTMEEAADSAREWMLACAVNGQNVGVRLAQRKE